MQQLVPDINKLINNKYINKLMNKTLYSILIYSMSCLVLSCFYATYLPNQMMMELFSCFVEWSFLSLELFHRNQRIIQTKKGTIKYLNSGDWVENCTSLEYKNMKWSMYEYSEKTKKNDIIDIHEEQPSIVDSIVNF